MSLDGFITGLNVRVVMGWGTMGIGIEAARELARAAAGDKNVGIWGGANIMREYLRAGSLDEMQIHLILILLGGGGRLFEDLDPEGNRIAEDKFDRDSERDRPSIRSGEMTQVILLVEFQASVRMGLASIWMNAVSVLLELIGATPGREHLILRVDMA